MKLWFLGLCVAFVLGGLAKRFYHHREHGADVLNAPVKALCLGEAKVSRKDAKALMDNYDLAQLDQTSLSNLEQNIFAHLCQKALIHGAMKKTYAYLPNCEAQGDLLERVSCYEKSFELFLEKHLFSDLKISKKEVENSYHQKVWISPEKVSFYHVFSYDLDQLKSLHKKLTAESIKHLTKNSSRLPQGVRWEKFHLLTREEIQGAFPMVFHLAPHHLSQVLPSPHGYHILMLEEHRAPGKLSLEEARGEIIKNLLLEKRREIFQKWYETALGSVPISLVFGEESCSGEGMGLQKS